MRMTGPTSPTGDLEYKEMISNSFLKTVSAFRKQAIFA